MSTVFYSLRVDSYCRFCLGPVFHSFFILMELSKHFMKKFLEFLGEALGAIGSTEVLSVLKEYSSDPVTEVNFK